MLKRLCCSLSCSRAQRARRGEEGRKAVIYLFTACVFKTASPTVMQKKGRGDVKMSNKKKKGKFHQSKNINGEV